MDIAINSEEYWNHRFKTKDWQEKGGNAQTAFFYNLLINLLPQNYKDLFHNETLTICDLGCAEGDGTFLLEQQFSNSKIHGVDIAVDAINNAKAKYKNINFSTKFDSDYDVVISSNTLEHFKDPFSEIEKILRRTKRYFILLLPFQEYERIDEHFTTFDYDSFPLKISDFNLTFLQSIKAKSIYWPGKQVLVIYERNTSPIVFNSNIYMLLEKKDRQIEDIESQMQDKDQQLQKLESQMQDKDQQLQKLREKELEISNLLKQLMKKVMPLQVPLSMHKLLYFAKRGEFKHIVKKTVEKLFQKQIILTSVSSDSCSVSERKFNFQDEIVMYVFPVIDWNFRIQRPQQIAKEFAKSNHKIIYFSTAFHYSKTAGYLFHEVDKNILGITLMLNETKNMYTDKLNSENINFLLQSITKLEKDLLINNQMCIIDHPFWFPLAKKLRGTFTVYDCMDYHPGFGDESAHLVELEEIAMTQSDLLVLTSNDLFSRFSSKNNNSILVRNGCEFDYFNTKPAKIYHSKYEKVIGYYGAIASWFDTNMVVQLAKKFNTYEFVLVGSTYGCENLKELESLSNITLIGEIPYTSLTEYLYAFDVAIMPFKINELTIATNPVKVYEYLSSGVAVVSTKLPEIELMGDVVYGASNLDEFVISIESALSNTDQSVAEKRKEFARLNDWYSRYTQIDAEIKAIKYKMPKVSIILVTYNNLDLTKECLESMEKFNNYENSEIIIVDNLSSDGTREFLSEYEVIHKNVKAILHDANSGFAGGNNIGIRASTGDIVILLNNDTYVAPNWISNLIKHFDTDEKIGMIGPRTNNIGNEARLGIAYDSKEEMVEKSYEIYYKNLNKQYEINVLAFFCVAIKREVIEKIGLLDEAYGIGMFEDDDYCMNAKEVGYKLICADDVFIHHHLGASFNKDPEWKEKLFQKNKAIYESRWGTWKGHTYR